MRLHFLGASRQVTGSHFLLETKHANIVVDCGMFQGSDFNEGRNHDPFKFDPKKIDAVILTHAHLDHSGRVPKLIHDGFEGVVYGTHGTLELAQLIWEDALAIMSYEHRKFGAPLLFHAEDIPPAIHACHGVDYKTWTKLPGGGRFRLLDAGHIFGSSTLELEIEGKRLVFSGDVGNTDMPIVRETEPLPNNIDVLLLESTYGDRIHEGISKRRQMIKENIVDAVRRGGVVLVPAFSIERTQELLYHLYKIIEREKDFPNVNIFLDSPLAIKAINVYEKYPQYYDAEALELNRSHKNFFKFKNLHMTLTRDESKMINNVKGPKIIIAGSGMMNGGRIVHHLFRYIEDPKSTVVIVGYQAEGTLGRRLYEGASEVQIMGETKKVRATVVAMGALSAHADQKKLIAWATAPEHPPACIYAVHGEPHAATELAHRLKEHLLHTDVIVPEEGLKVEV